MPKKSVTPRGGAQRNKPKVQKSFELVRPFSDEQEVEDQSIAEPVASVSTATVAAPEASQAPAEKEEKELVATTNASTSTAPKGSASARIAARRQAAQKTPQRNPAALVTAEHYAYVRKDLIFIAILAIIMFGTIIALRFVPGIGY